MQGHFVEQMWIFTGPDPTALAVYIPVKVEPCFIFEENYQASSFHFPR
jgi:hypothetical protein